MSSTVGPSNFYIEPSHLRKTQSEPNIQATHEDPSADVHKSESAVFDREVVKNQKGVQVETSDDLLPDIPLAGESRPLRDEFDIVGNKPKKAVETVEYDKTLSFVAECSSKKIHYIKQQHLEKTEYFNLVKESAQLHRQLSVLKKELVQNPRDTQLQDTILDVEREMLKVDWEIQRILMDIPELTEAEKNEISRCEADIERAREYPKHAKTDTQKTKISSNTARDILTKAESFEEGQASLLPGLVNSGMHRVELHDATTYTPARCKADHDALYEKIKGLEPGSKVLKQKVKAASENLQKDIDLLKKGVEQLRETANKSKKSRDEAHSSRLEKLKSVDEEHSSKLEKLESESDLRDEEHSSKLEKLESNIRITQMKKGLLEVDINFLKKIINDNGKSEVDKDAARRKIEELSPQLREFDETLEKLENERETLISSYNQSVVEANANIKKAEDELNKAAIEAEASQKVAEDALNKLVKEAEGTLKSAEDALFEVERLKGLYDHVVESRLDLPPETLQHAADHILTQPSSPESSYSFYQTGIIHDDRNGLTNLMELTDVLNKLNDAKDRLANVENVVPKITSSGKLSNDLNKVKARAKQVESEKNKIIKKVSDVLDFKIKELNQRLRKANSEKSKGAVQYAIDQFNLIRERLNTNKYTIDDAIGVAKEIMDDRRHVLEVQFLQLVTAQAIEAGQEKPANISQNTPLYIVHLAQLNPSKDKMSSNGWAHVEKNNILDMAGIFKEFEGKKLIWDGEGPFVDNDGNIHLPELRADENNQPIRQELKPIFLDLSVQGHGQRDQAFLNQVNAHGMNQLNDMIRTKDSSSSAVKDLKDFAVRAKQQSNWDLSENFMVTMLSLNREFKDLSCRVSCGCQSCKDRGPIVAARACFRLREQMRNEAESEFLSTLDDSESNKAKKEAYKKWNQSERTTDFGTILSDKRIVVNGIRANTLKSFCQSRDPKMKGQRAIQFVRYFRQALSSAV